MHSYENGSSLACKSNNWEQIQTVLSRLDIDLVSVQVADNVIYRKDNAARDLMCTMYAHLTNRP